MEGTGDFYRQQVIAATHRLVEEGLLIATGGNVSVRIEGQDRVAITPSSRDYHGLRPEDICIVDFDLRRVEGGLVPSVETSAHVAVYKARPDVNAIIHSHQVHASIFSLIDHPIPPLFDEQVAHLGRQVEIVPYALSGTVDLLHRITTAVENKCNAFILQNHGTLVLGLDLEKAVLNVEVLERTARVYHGALLTGRPVTGMPEQATTAIFELLLSEQRKETRRKRKLARGQDGGAP